VETLEEILNKALVNKKSFKKKYGIHYEYKKIIRPS